MFYCKFKDYSKVIIIINIYYYYFKNNCWCMYTRQRVDDPRIFKTTSAWLSSHQTPHSRAMFRTSQPPWFNGVACAPNVHRASCQWLFFFFSLHLELVLAPLKTHTSPCKFIYYLHSALVLLIIYFLKFSIIFKIMSIFQFHHLLFFLSIDIYQIIIFFTFSPCPFNYLFFKIFNNL